MLVFIQKILSFLDPLDLLCHSHLLSSLRSSSNKNMLHLSKFQIFKISNWSSLSHSMLEEKGRSKGLHICS